MMRAAARLVRENQEELSRLDSVGGDGDHGTTMVRAMDRLEAAIDENPSVGLGELLQNVGWAIMGVDGGATGPLFGTLFMSMSSVMEGETLDARSLASAFAAGLDGVQKNTRARTGDKTMIDALEPAVAALCEAAASGEEIVAALVRASDAADEGVRATRTMQARFGRAKNIGDKSIGNQDPGATSVSLIFRGFLEGARDDG
ncbi:MAG: dihydroxyacetone kinase subunit DhaL [Planctomycetota bacterium]|jgi:dihydroxyacetone kinase-like protein